MEYSDKQLMEYQKLAYNFALYKTGNFTAAEDIAAQTISLLLLSYKPEADIKTWILNTSKHYCNKYFTKLKKEKFNYKTTKEELKEKLISSEFERDEALHNAYRESFNSLNDIELRTLLYFFQCNENIKEMHNNIGGSYSTLRKRVSRTKNKIKAETYKRLGYLGSKKIVTPQLNDQIVKFLKRFKENLENGTLEKMYYYFSEIDLKKYNPSYDIKKIVYYDIELNEAIYKVWVFYKNTLDDTDSFYIEFIIDDRKHLKILTPPIRLKKVFKMNINSDEAKQILNLLKSYPIDKTGHPNIPDSEIEKILRQHKEKQKKPS